MINIPSINQQVFRNHMDTLVKDTIFALEESHLPNIKTSNIKQTYNKALNNWDEIIQEPVSKGHFLTIESAPYNNAIISILPAKKTGEINSIYAQTILNEGLRNILGIIEHNTYLDYEKIKFDELESYILPKHKKKGETYVPQTPGAKSNLPLDYLQILKAYEDRIRFNSKYIEYFPLNKEYKYQ